MFMRKNNIIINKKNSGIITLLLFTLLVFCSQLTYAEDMVHSFDPMHLVNITNSKGDVKITAMGIRDLGNDEYRISLLLENNNGTSTNIKLNGYTIVLKDVRGNSRPLEIIPNHPDANVLLLGKQFLVTMVAKIPQSETKANINYNFYKVTIKYRCNLGLDDASILAEDTIEKDPFEYRLYKPSSSIPSYILYIKNNQLDSHNPITIDFWSMGQGNSDPHCIDIVEPADNLYLEPSENTTISFSPKLNTKCYEYLSISYTDNYGQVQTFLIPIEMSRDEHDNWTLMQYGEGVTIAAVVIAAGMVIWRINHGNFARPQDPRNGDAPYGGDGGDDAPYGGDGGDDAPYGGGGAPHRDGGDHGSPPLHGDDGDAPHIDAPLPALAPAPAPRQVLMGHDGRPRDPATGHFISRASIAGPVILTWQ